MNPIKCFSYAMLPPPQTWSHASARAAETVPSGVVLRAGGLARAAAAAARSCGAHAWRAERTEFRASRHCTAVAR